MKHVELSPEVSQAIADYHYAVDKLGRLGPRQPDRFGYSTETFRDYEAAVIRARERMEALLDEIYRQAH